jgi:hypothetical protein
MSLPRAVALLFVCHGVVFFTATLLLGYSPDRAFLLRYLVD